MGYISNYLPLVQIEKPFYKTHPTVRYLGSKESF